MAVLESVPKGGLERRKGMNPKPYPSDLTSQQWAVLKPLLPPARTGGRPRKTEMRSVVNAIFYRNRNGCIWRALPHGTEQEFSSSYEHMEGDTTARPIGRTEPVSIVWREPPRMSVSLSRSSKFANKSSLSMSPSPRAHLNASIALLVSIPPTLHG